LQLVIKKKGKRKRKRKVREKNKNGQNAFKGAPNITLY
jgi:hypothetical protein